MSCYRIQSSNYKLCASDLKNKIKIQYPSSTVSNAPGVNGLSTFTDVVEVWSKVVTSVGQELSVDQVNTSSSSNIDFYIRYTSSVDLDRELWVLYDSKRYKIISPENIDEKNKTIRLGAILRGQSTVEANQR